MKTKLCRPVLVETKEPANIFKDHTGLFHSNLNLQTGHSINSSVIGYKLILISLDPNEKIEIGDEWIYICPINDIDYGDKCEAIVTNNLKSNWFDKLHDRPNYKKVIAPQSQLSEEYIQKFVEEYNSGNVKDIEIKMDGNYAHEYGGYYVETITPKLTNGFVTIVNNKEPILYTEEEVENLFENWLNTKVQEELMKLSGEMDSIDGVTFKDWFQENKKK